MINSKRDEYYTNRHQALMRMYWEKNDGTNIYLPNGIVGPDHIGEVYNPFCEQITHGGKVLDLGCGNGLMLRYLMEHTQFKLIPYGVDFIEPSIRQAKEIIHPEYGSNFALCNIMDYGYKDAPFDFIFADPYDIYPEDMPKFLEDVLKACADGGRVIFYTYHDVLERLGCSWVREFPGMSELTLERKDYPAVSIGIYERRA